VGVNGKSGKTNSRFWPPWGGPKKRLRGGKFSALPLRRGEGKGVKQQKEKKGNFVLIISPRRKTQPFWDRGRIFTGQKREKGKEKNFRAPFAAATHQRTTLAGGGKKGEGGTQTLLLIPLRLGSRGGVGTLCFVERGEGGKKREERSSPIIRSTTPKGEKTGPSAFE